MITLTLEEAKKLYEEWLNCGCPHGPCDEYPHPQHTAFEARIEAQQ